MCTCARCACVILHAHNCRFSDQKVTTPRECARGMYGVCMGIPYTYMYVCMCVFVCMCACVRMYMYVCVFVCLWCVYTFFFFFFRSSAQLRKFGIKLLVLWLQALRENAGDASMELFASAIPHFPPRKTPLGLPAAPPPPPPAPQTPPSPPSSSSAPPSRSPSPAPSPYNRSTSSSVTERYGAYSPSFDSSSLGGAAPSIKTAVKG